MKKFIIITDSCSDLEKELREKYDIEYVPMSFRCEGKEYVADLDWKELSATDFYDMMRKGKIFKTAQVNASQYREAFEKYIEGGYDILSISCSSGLSNSVNESRKVAKELQEKYPDTKIYCIDSLNSCYGLGLLCITASELRKEGLSIDEVKDFIENNKLKMNQECTVEKLTYLKNAGRVSAASAFFGGLLSVKPIIISDAKGSNNAVEKVKGRKTSINRIAERFAMEYEKNPYQKIYFAHADCLLDVEELKKAVLSKIDASDIEIHTGYVGPVVGASAGPGTIAVYFFGKEVTVGA
ncbi:MAG: DegV family protein [Clostridia bacterium]|nr:DegV family protein [Clostridia bacterium]